MIKALVLYHSQQSGNTAKMAEAVAEGLKSEGLEVTLHNANERRFPLSEFSKYGCVAFGTPDYFGYLAGTMKTFLDDWYLQRNQPGNSGKPYAVFYSHGGGGRVKDTLTLFSRIGTIVGDPIGSRGVPTPEVLEACKQLGIKLGKSVK
ncbi:FprA family A-type flavoprotein [Candidatus Bathyarchaeota archaeon]|nr:FprA family A-type flavoprotein [Candidatus Bathyarchaeota archaeon]